MIGSMDTTAPAPAADIDVTISSTSEDDPLVTRTINGVTFSAPASVVDDIDVIPFDGTLPTFPDLPDEERAEILRREQEKHPDSMISVMRTGDVLVIPAGLHTPAAEDDTPSPLEALLAAAMNPDLADGEQR